MMANQPKVKITDAEKVYRTKYYHDFRVVSKRQLVCTSCGNEVSSQSRNVFSHPILEVLQCKTCLDKYQETDFKTKKGRCILCCKYSSYTCGNKSCRYEYCRKCIKRNVSHCIQEAEKDDWQCFVCDPKPFWELRGVCAAIMSSLNKNTKQSKRTSRERSQDPSVRRLKRVQISSPYQKRVFQKSKKTLKTLHSLCDSSDEEGRKKKKKYLRPLHMKGLSDVEDISDKSRLSSASSSEDFEPSQKRPTSKQKTSRKITKSPTSSSNSSSYFQKSKHRSKVKPKPTDKNRRKLYTHEEKELDITPAEISSDEDQEKKQKQATLRFKHNFSGFFKDARALVQKFSSEIDICEKQCMKKTLIKEEDALQTTKRFEKILRKFEVETAEKSKEIDKTYQSWHKNFNSCFRTQNGIKKPKRRRRSSSSSSTSEEEKEEDEELEEETEKGEKVLEIENNENGVVSECDSDAIFSGDETRRKSSSKISEDSESEKKSFKKKSSRRNSSDRSSDRNSRKCSSVERSPIDASSRGSSVERNSKRTPKINLKSTSKIDLRSSSKRHASESSDRSSSADRMSKRTSERYSKRTSKIDTKSSSKRHLSESSDKSSDERPAVNQNGISKSSSLEEEVPEKKAPENERSELERRSESEEEEAKKKLLLSDSDDAQQSTPKSHEDSVASCSTVLGNVTPPIEAFSPQIDVTESDKELNSKAKNMLLESSSDSGSRKDASDSEENHTQEKDSTKKVTKEKESTKMHAEKKVTEENKSDDSEKQSEEQEKCSNLETETLNASESTPQISKEVSSKKTSEEAFTEKNTSPLSESEVQEEKEDSASKSQNDKSSEEKAKKNLLKSSSDSSLGEEAKVDDSEDEKRAKQALMTSSGEESPDLFTSFEVKPSKRKRNNSDTENSESCRSRRRKKFKLSKNPYYRADKKLRMSCRVELKRLSRQVLRKHAKALQRSKQHLEREKLKSLVSMDNIEKIRKKSAIADSSDDDSESGSKHRSCKKKTQKEDETLLDHLKKVENGDAEKQTSSKSSDVESSEDATKKQITTEDLFANADERAKEMVLNSSDSELETANDKIDESETEKEKKKKKKEKKDKEAKEELKEESKKGKKIKDEEKNSDDSVEDEEETKKKKEKSKWKQDKILKMTISDSDSEAEKKKFDKHQEKLKAKKKEEGSSSNEDEPKIVKVKTKRTKRKIFESDSDVKLTDLSDSDSSSDSDKDKGKEDKKKSRKRGHRKSSDSDSSLGEKKAKPKRKRIKAVTDSDSDSDAATNSQSSPLKGGRRNIRKVLKDKQVADDTKLAAKEEEERLKRIADRQKVYNEMYEIRLAGEEKVEKLVLDFDEETKEELVSVHPDLVKRLKPHQARGIKFMWDACFESLERIKTSKGSGCIIAHCMGLGKTFQIVTLVHTLLSNKETGVNTVMVVCPLSTALNWAGEFEMWLKDLSNYDDIEVYELGKYKQNFERKYQLEHWKKHGGVLIIGYDMFRNLTGTGKKMRKSMQTSILECLVDPGPDVIVCDEGHLLKNEDTALSKAMRKVKTLRRIVLTGTPLQNNLVEYHCMVQFVKPNLLGTKKEFSNRFVNPIKNGSAADSTPYDVKLMKKRAFILHNLLEGSVQRFDYSVLTPFLPPKNEYVISVKLTPLQIKLYQYYLDNFTRGARGPRLFADYHAMQRICTHPIVMKMNAEKMEKKRQEEETDSEGSLKDFVVDESDSSDCSSNSGNSGSDIQCIDSDKEAPVKRRGTRANPVEDSIAEVEPEIAEPREWWSEMIKPEDFEDMRISAKLVLLFGILKESEQIGDKVLVFSQSLYSLTLIEEFLSRIDDATQNNSQSENLENHTGSWSLGLDYFRLDGQTSAENRSHWCKIFNRPSNTRARLFLISTRAGGLGINLTAANRVIIFDASWNPSHDVQSIFRIYRFGQKKPCYIYRFLSKGTMEEKIYNRQVSKLSLACRVIDEQQIERHFNSSDLAEMYTFDPNPPRESETLNLPKDRLLAEIFLKYKDLVHNYHEHDSLLENQLDEVLDEEDRKIAWQEYEDEKKGKPVMQFAQGNQFGFNPMSMNLFNGPINLGSEVETLANFLKKDYPTRTAEELRQLAQNNILNMYSSYVEGQAIQRNHPNQYLTQQYAPMMQPYIQQQQLQYRQQQQQQQMMKTLQRQQQERFAQMPVAGTPAALIDISSPPNSQGEE